MRKININKALYFLFDRLIRGYQLFISPIIPARCRYYPTCSEYARQALLWHGVCQGGILIVHRISRCQPWGGCGIDFVPLPLYRLQFDFVDSLAILPLSHQYYVFYDTGYSYYLNQKLSSKI